MGSKTQLFQFCFCLIEENTGTKPGGVERRFAGMPSSKSPQATQHDTIRHVYLKTERRTMSLQERRHFKLQVQDNATTHSYTGVIDTME